MSILLKKSPQTFILFRAMFEWRRGYKKCQNEQKTLEWILKIINFAVVVIFFQKNLEIKNKSIIFAVPFENNGYVR